MLTLKAPITTAADDIKNFHCFSDKIRIDVSCEYSARQRIHMKNQALFSLTDKSKTLKCLPLQLLFGALRVNWKSGAFHLGGPFDISEIFLTQIRLLIKSIQTISG